VNTFDNVNVRNVLYFGLQAKRDKLDAAGDSKASTRNVAEIHNQH